MRNCPMIVIFFFIRLIMYPYKEILFEILGDKKDVINFFSKNIYKSRENEIFLNSMFPPSLVQTSNSWSFPILLLITGLPKSTW